jgi:glycine/serine hydroxymethyltransferase
MIANLIVSVLKSPYEETLIAKTRQKVHELCQAFPIYQE